MTYYSSQLEVSHILAIWLGVLLEPIVDVSNCHCPASWIFIWRAISSRKTVKALTSLLDSSLPYASIICVILFFYGPQGTHSNAFLHYNFLNLCYICLCFSSAATCAHCLVYLYTTLPILHQIFLFTFFVALHSSYLFGSLYCNI